MQTVFYNNTGATNFFAFLGAHGGSVINHGTKYFDGDIRSVLKAKRKYTYLNAINTLVNKQLIGLTYYAGNKKVGEEGAIFTSSQISEASDTF